MRTIDFRPGSRMSGQSYRTGIEVRSPSVETRWPTTASAWRVSPARTIARRPPGSRRSSASRKASQVPFATSSARFLAAGDPAVVRRPEEPHARIPARDGLDDARRAIGRTVVDDEALERDVRLLEHRRERTCDRCLGVPRRDDHAQPRIHAAMPLPPASPAYVGLLHGMGTIADTAPTPGRRDRCYPPGAATALPPRARPDGNAARGGVVGPDPRPGAHQYAWTASTAATSLCVARRGARRRPRAAAAARW